MSSPEQPPTADQIQSQLDRIFASETFVSSKRIRELLEYLVNESRREGRPRLKELAIGIAVFGRDETFDPRIDSVVRVEVGRLRSKLREYYAGVGVDDPVRIEVPKGSYVPTIGIAQKRNDATMVLPTRQLWPKVVGIALSILVLAVGIIYLTMQEVLSPVSVSTEGIHTLAVLPLKDWTGNTDDYFSEAMTDVLIASLSGYPELRITSLSSVMNYKATHLQPSQIAEQLGVESIVDGTVFREADRVRITVNLIDAIENRNIWSETYNRSMTGVLALQEDVASEIARQLVGELVQGDRPPEREINPFAYEAFLKGTYWRNRLTAEGFNRGLVFFQQAIDLQPDYAEAYAAMAACHCRLAGHGIEVIRPDIALTQSTRLATQSLALNGTLAEPNAVLGIIKFKFDWDPEASVAYLERALQQNPSLFEAHLWLSEVAEGMKRPEQAVAHARQAHRLNPLSLAANLNLGWQFLQAGRINEAEEQFDKLLEFDPEFWGAHWGKGHLYLERKFYQEAIQEFSRAVELEGGHTLPLATLGYSYGISGQREAALGVLETLQGMGEDVYVSPVHVAMVYAGMGDKDAAFEWLDKGFEIRARTMAWLSVRREFNGLHNDPRYGALVASVGIDEHSLE